MTQRAEALARASEVFAQRAKLKARIREQPTTSESARVAAQVLRMDSPATTRMDVWKFLTQVRRMQTRTALAQLNAMGIAHNRRVGELTARQRETLAQWLESR